MTTFWTVLFGLLSVVALISAFAREGYRKFVFVGTLWLFAGLTFFVFFIAIVYVAVHFISKYW